MSGCYSKLPVDFLANKACCSGQDSQLHLKFLFVQLQMCQLTLEMILVVTGYESYYLIVVGINWERIVFKAHDIHEILLWKRI